MVMVKFQDDGKSISGSKEATGLSSYGLKMIIMQYGFTTANLETYGFRMLLH